MNPSGGTPLYMAPELICPPNFGLQRSQPSREADIYAFGMVVYEIVMGVRPFGMENFGANEVMWKVLKGTRPMKPVNAKTIGFGRGVWELVEECWSANRMGRPKARDVRGHLSAVATRSPTVGPGPAVYIPPTLDISADTMASGTNCK